MELRQWKADFERERDSGSCSMNVHGKRMCFSLREINYSRTVFKYEGIMSWVKLDSVLILIILACS